MIPAPQTLKKLIDSPEGAELCKYLQSVIISVDTVQDIDIDDPIAYSVEGKARKLAVQKLSEVLNVFLLAKDFRVTIKEKNDDYSVNV